MLFQVYLENLLSKAPDSHRSLWLLEACFQPWSSWEPSLSGNVLCTQISQIGKIILQSPGCASIYDLPSTPAEVYLMILMNMLSLPFRLILFLWLSSKWNWRNQGNMGWFESGSGSRIKGHFTIVIGQERLWSSFCFFCFSFLCVSFLSFLFFSSCSLLNFSKDCVFWVHHPLSDLYPFLANSLSLEIGNHGKWSNINSCISPQYSRLAILHHYIKTKISLACGLPISALFSTNPQGLKGMTRT